MATKLEGLNGRATKKITFLRLPYVPESKHSDQDPKLWFTLCECSFQTWKFGQSCPWIHQDALYCYPATSFYCLSLSAIDNIGDIYITNTKRYFYCPWFLCRWSTMIDLHKPNEYLFHLYLCYVYRNVYIVNI